MSKDLEITLYIADELECNIKSIICLLKKIGWTLTEDNGKIKIFDRTTGEWKISTKSYDNYSIEDKEAYFQMQNSDGQIFEININNDNSFSVWIEAYAKKIVLSKHEFYDYNWYYENIVNRLNEGQCIVERAVFYEY